MEAPIIVTKALYTVEEFEAFADLPENDERLIELIHGRIHEKMPNEKHSVVALRFGSKILVFVEVNQLGGRAGVEGRHRLPQDKYNARIPDVHYTSAARLKPVTDKGSILQMPDLAIEVASPNDTPDKLREKAQYDLQNGSRLVWLAYPESETIEVCTLTDDGRMRIVTLTIHDMLTGGDVLPGFSVPVNEIFKY